ncbi:MAG TPA: hypothetical protein PLL77_10955 [Pyrinomonadaceae bacterium]|nr:hypothetical protein [Pyrinomonadaceae bacterium]
MADITYLTDSDTADEVPDFSLTQGGLTYRFFCWTGLCNNELGLVHRRVLVIAAVAWLPLFLLSLFGGHSLFTPFLNDVTAHGRFLIALPALLAAEAAAHKMIGPRIKNFITRKIVAPADIPRFKAAIDAAHIMRNSTILEAGLMILVYTLGLWVWRSEIAAGTPTWYASPDGTNMNLSLTGYWLVFVSVPIFQFFLVRWYARFVIWFVFLLRVSRLDLKLMPTHSDRSAGLGFLGPCLYGFALVLFAQGTLLSVSIANSALHAGRNVMDFKLSAVAFILFFVFAALGPLLVFLPGLVKAKWEALEVYGSLASHYVAGFDNKWIEGVNPNDEPLLGTGDIQSLADLSNSYAVLQSMHPVPFDLRDLLWLFGMSAVPLLPLAFFVFSFEELVDKLIQILL